MIQCFDEKWPQDTCNMTSEADDILDTRNTIGVRNLDGYDANWESWRVKVEVHADLATYGTTFGPRCRTVHSLLITKCEGKISSLVSLVLRRFELEVWRPFKEDCEGKDENRTAVFMRGMLNALARWEVYIEGRDFGDMLASGERDVAQYSRRFDGTLTNILP